MAAEAEYREIFHANSEAIFSVSIDNKCQNITNLDKHTVNTNSVGQYHFTTSVWFTYLKIPHVWGTK